MQEAARQLDLPYQTFRYRATQLRVYRPRPNPTRIEGLSNARKEYLDRITTPLQEILTGKHPTYPTRSLKERLFREGLKKSQCEECKIETWNGKRLVLELDHVDGNKENHRLSNLRILCPNCHSQTPTFRKSKGAKKRVMKQLRPRGGIGRPASLRN